MANHLFLISNLFRTQGTDSDFVTDLNDFQFVKLDDRGNTVPQLMVDKLITYNTIKNITSTNCKFRYLNSSVWRTADIPTGVYSLADLYDAMKTIMLDLGDVDASDPDNIVYNLTLTFNENTGYVKVDLAEDWQLDLSYAGSFGDLLGSNSLITESGYLARPCDFSNGVKFVMVHCDLVKKSLVGKRAAKVLCIFHLDRAPNSIIYQDIETELVNIDASSGIQNYRVWLTDQNGRAVELADGTEFTMVCYLKY